MRFSPKLHLALGRVASPLTGGANGLLGRLSADGLGGQFLLGMLLGAVWSPCAGPALGAAIGLAAQSGTTAQAAAIMLLFSLGAASPMIALAYGSRQAMAARRDRLATLARWCKPVMGAVLLVTGILILTGTDKVIEARLIEFMPTWLADATTRF